MGVLADVVQSSSHAAREVSAEIPATAKKELKRGNSISGTPGRPKPTTTELCNAKMLVCVSGAYRKYCGGQLLPGATFAIQIELVASRSAEELANNEDLTLLFAEKVGVWITSAKFYSSLHMARCFHEHGVVSICSPPVFDSGLEIMEFVHERMHEAISAGRSVHNLQARS